MIRVYQKGEYEEDDINAIKVNWDESSATEVDKFEENRIRYIVKDVKVTRILENLDEFELQEFNDSPCPVLGPFEKSCICIVKAKALEFYEPESGKAISITYPAISLCATMNEPDVGSILGEQAENETNSTSIYLQIDPSKIKDSNGPVHARHAAPYDDYGNIEYEEYSFIEVKLTPKETFTIQELYEALNECSNLYPSEGTDDSESESESESGDEEYEDEDDKDDDEDDKDDGDDKEKKETANDDHLVIKNSKIAKIK